MAPVPPAGGLSDAGATGGSGLLAGGSARQRIGTSAEDRAADHLEAAGLRLLVRNYRCRMGELDLVALDGDVLVGTSQGIVGRIRPSRSWLATPPSTE